MSAGGIHLVHLICVCGKRNGGGNQTHRQSCETFFHKNPSQNSWLLVNIFVTADHERNFQSTNALIREEPAERDCEIPGQDTLRAWDLNCDRMRGRKILRWKLNLRFHFPSAVSKTEQFPGRVLRIACGIGRGRLPYRADTVNRCVTREFCGNNRVAFEHPRIPPCRQ